MKGIYSKYVRCLTGVSLGIWSLQVNSGEALTEYTGTWSSSEVVESKQRVEFNDLYDQLAGLLEYGVEIPVVQYEIRASDYDGLSGIAYRQNLYVGKYPPSVSKVFCHLNELYCDQNFNINKPLNVGSSIVLPKIEIQSHDSIKNYSKKSGETFEEIVIKNNGCEAWDQSCIRVVYRLNYYNLDAVGDEQNVLFDDYEGDIVIPAKTYRAPIWIRFDSNNQAFSNLSGESFNEQIWMKPPGAIERDPEKRRNYKGVSQKTNQSQDVNLKSTIQTLNSSLNKVSTKSAGYNSNHTSGAFASSNLELLEEINHPADKLDEFLRDHMRAEIGILDGWVDDSHCLFQDFNSMDIQNDENMTQRIQNLYSEGTCESIQTNMLDVRDHGSHVLSMIRLVLLGNQTSPSTYSTHVSSDYINTEEDIFDAIKAAMLDRLRRDFSPMVYNISITDRFLENTNAVSALQKEINETFLSNIHVLASGNDGIRLEPGACTVEPPCFAADPKNKNILNVAAFDGDKLLEWTDPVTQKTFKSNSGSVVHVAAPGSKITGASYGHRIGDFSGTSQAAPLVAATAALLLDRAIRKRNPEYVRDRIIYSSDFLPTLRQEGLLGGKLNVERALDTKYFFEKVDGEVHRGDELEDGTLDGYIQITEASTNATCFVHFRDILRLSRFDTGDASMLAFEIFLKNDREDSIFFALNGDEDAKQACIDIFPANTLSRRLIAFSGRQELITGVEMFSNPTLLTKPDGGDFFTSVEIPISDIENYVRALDHGFSH